jgi:hypothetical protein
MDEDGPTIASGFNKENFRGSDGKPSLEPDITRSCHVLNALVKKFPKGFVPSLGSFHPHGLVRWVVPIFSQHHSYPIK